jgi:hypothetical protein
MKPGITFREPVRVVMHLHGGYTKVLVERLVGSGMAGGAVYRDIPSDRIPAHQRELGSRFLLYRQTFRPEPGDSADQIRTAAQDLIIEELPARSRQQSEATPR